jgi:hypothetical protein
VEVPASNCVNRASRRSEASGYSARPELIYAGRTERDQVLLPNRRMLRSEPFAERQAIVPLQWTAEVRAIRELAARELWLLVREIVDAERHLHRLRQFHPIGHVDVVARFELTIRLQSRVLSRAEADDAARSDTKFARPGTGWYIAKIARQCAGSGAGACRSGRESVAADVGI